ncbi:hypothetical protein R5W23_003718 [Gemmata sp. JC673]|uniref:Uncharacterized protein n=1 Tax=Gemmata algarum TaxID=2975278 RepID=A0ABU5F8S4_9BACT|nr:hypothetical protein [Gemmata algarum]MDY3562256.1 hypothetical protein [Gemmata algarum]
MTEAEWLAATDPTPMLAFIRSKVSERKLRLFAVACCQGACRLLQSQRFQNAIEMSELFADGLASDGKLRKARSQARESARLILSPGRVPPWSRAVRILSARSMVISVCSRNIDEVIQALSHVCVTADSSESDELNRKLERQHRAAVLREVVQFRPVAADPLWLTSTVLALAEGIYAANAFDRLPILADALQDVGCSSDDILSHLRSDGPHVKGCWALDGVLGKS